MNANPRQYGAIRRQAIRTDCLAYLANVRQHATDPSKYCSVNNVAEGLDWHLNRPAPREEIRRALRELFDAGRISRRLHVGPKRTVAYYRARG